MDNVIKKQQNEPCYWRECEKRDGSFDLCWCSEEHKALWQEENYGETGGNIKISTETRELVNKLRNKEIELKDIMSRNLFFLVKYYWSTKNKEAMDACVAEAKRRLEEKGLKYINGEGWC